jgi:group I intron endonuclease
MRIVVENLDELKLKGVYRIFCLENEKYYIGSTSKSFKQRFTQHLSKLNTGNHSCAHLQNAFDKYGKDSFEFSIIEIISDLDNILIREKF